MSGPLEQVTLTERLEALRAERGDSIDVGEIADVVESLMKSMDGDLSALDLQIHDEIYQLVEYIRKVKGEIADIRPTKIKEHYIPEATDELDAIVNMTASATETILEMVEGVEGLMPDMPAEVAAKVGDSVTRIYEACNFQDITGQRIKKIVEALKYIDEKIEKLAAAVGHTPDLEPEEVVDKKSGDGNLLHGPQLPENANSQADIDSLFD
jgi:chemotaxis protein CheZ